MGGEVLLRLRVLEPILDNILEEKATLLEKLDKISGLSGAPQDIKNACEMIKKAMGQPDRIMPLLDASAHPISATLLYRHLFAHFMDLLPENFSENNQRLYVIRLESFKDKGDNLYIRCKTDSSWREVLKQRLTKLCGEEFYEQSIRLAGDASLVQIKPGNLLDSIQVNPKTSNCFDEIFKCFFSKYQDTIFASSDAQSSDVEVLNKIKINSTKAGMNINSELYAFAKAYVNCFYQEAKDFSKIDYKRFNQRYSDDYSARDYAFMVAYAKHYEKTPEDILKALNHSVYYIPERRYLVVVKSKQDYADEKQLSRENPKAIPKGGMGKFRQGVCLQTGDMVGLKISPNTHVNITPDTVKQSTLQMAKLFSLAIFGMRNRLPPKANKMIVLQDYIEGTQLGIWMKQNPVQPGMPPTTSQYQTALWCVNALRQLQERRIVHMDIKPENMIVIDNGVKIIDFDMAKGIPSNKQEVSTASMGTTGLIAPEVIIGLVNLTSDCWGLAVTLMMLLGASKNTYQACMDKRKDLAKPEDVVAINQKYILGPKVNPEIDGLLRDIFQQPPEKRPSLVQLATALQCCIDRPAPAAQKQGQSFLSKSFSSFKPFKRK